MAAASSSVLIVADPAPVYFRIGGPEPEIEGEGSEVVPTVGGLRVQSTRQGRTVVKLISAGTPKVCVRGLRA